MNSTANDQFETWLIEMDDALERLKLSLPQPLCGMDLGIEALAPLEHHYLSEFPSVEEALLPTSAIRIDSYARFVGETLRTLAGGTWRLETSSPDQAYFGLPVLSGAYGTICPLTLVTAAADRRTGDFWTTIVSNQVAHNK
jgi:hypothetical protein